MAKELVLKRGQSISLFDERIICGRGFQFQGNYSQHQRVAVFGVKNVQPISILAIILSQ